MGDWLNFIHGNCQYFRKVKIFGQSDNKDFRDPLISKMDVYKKCSLLNIPADYYELHTYKEEEIIQLIDEIVSEEKKVDNSVIESNTKGVCSSFKRENGDKCLIF